MKYMFLLILFVGIATGCDKDKMGPSIMLSDTDFCVDPGEDIRLTIEIMDEDLDMVNITVPDLDFINSVTGDQFRDANGAIEFIFTLDSNTVAGTYLMGIEALDELENASTSEVDIKVN